MTPCLSPLLLAATLAVTHAPLATELEAAVRARAQLPADATVAVVEAVPANAALFARSTGVKTVELPEGEDGLGSLTARAHLDVPGAPDAWTWIRARVSVSVPTVVSARALSRDAVLGPEDVEIEPRPLRRGQLAPSSPLLGLVLRRAVRAGEPLQEGWLRAPIAIERGDRVQAIVRGPGLRVRASAESLGRGAVSEVVRIKLLGSGRVVRAVIRGPREVEVMP